MIVVEKELRGHERATYLRRTLFRETTGYET